MPPLVSIVTPSFNKPEYVTEAIESVLNQTLTDFEYWLIENSTDDKTRKVIQPYLKDPRIKYLEFDFTDQQRHSFYITAHILNAVYPELEGKYIFYLSDDDLLMPTCLEEMADFLETAGDRYVVYHTQKWVNFKDGQWVDSHLNACTNPRGLDTNWPNVDCAIDGGQIMHRTSCLYVIDTPYFPEDLDSAPHCDGIFMDKLAAKFTFHRLPHINPLSIHRTTPKSTWTKVV